MLLYKEVRESFLTGLLHPIRAALCGAEVTGTHTCGERIRRQVTRGGTRVPAPPRVASVANPASASAAGNSPQTLHPPRPAGKPPVLVPVSCERLLLQPGSPCAQRGRPEGSHIAGRLRLRRHRPLPRSGGTRASPHEHPEAAAEQHAARHQPPPGTRSGGLKLHL